MVTIDDINIRTRLHPGDIGYIIHMHGKIYSTEYQYGLSFEAYVAESMAEFSFAYNPERDCVWVCEHENRIIGFLSLVDRGEMAQLRYFVIEKNYRGIGLGKVLMKRFFNTLAARGYRGAYLLTADELPAAASLYQRYGFALVDEETSDKFGKKVILQRYELNHQPIHS